VYRIDIHIEVPAISLSRLRSRADQLGSAAMRQNVTNARDVQAKRFGNGPPPRLASQDAGAGSPDKVGMTNINLGRPTKLWHSVSKYN